MAKDAFEGVDKRALVAELKGRLAAELSRYSERARDAAEAATHEENRPEGDKDMRSTEASYIARGQATRARDVEQSLARLSAMTVRAFAEDERIAASALVELDQRGRTTLVLLITAAGGERLSADGVEVSSLATTSPLGAAILGLAAGDDFEITTAAGVRAYSVLRVR